MKFLYFWLTGVTNQQIQTFLGWSNDKVYYWHKYVRELVATVVLSDTRQIGGQDIIVEIDASKFGKRKHNRGHYVDGAWVFGGVENTPERRLLQLH
jgi:hypothetical protein